VIIFNEIHPKSGQISLKEDHNLPGLQWRLTDSITHAQDMTKSRSQLRHLLRQCVENPRSKPAKEWAIQWGQIESQSFHIMRYAN
jgi:hypothetical protein